MHSISKLRWLHVSAQGHNLQQACVSGCALCRADAVLGLFCVCAVPVPKTTICSQTLSSDDAGAFKYAILRHYWYELFVDDLPVWGFVGDIKPGKAAGEDGTLVLYTHKQLDISYNGDRVSLS